MSEAKLFYLTSGCTLSTARKKKTLKLQTRTKTYDTSVKYFSKSSGVLPFGK